LAVEVTEEPLAVEGPQPEVAYAAVVQVSQSEEQWELVAGLLFGFHSLSSK